MPTNISFFTQNDETRRHKRSFLNILWTTFSNFLPEDVKLMLDKEPKVWYRYLPPFMSFPENPRGAISGGGGGGEGQSLPPPPAPSVARGLKVTTGDKKSANDQLPASKSKL